MDEVLDTNLNSGTPDPNMGGHPGEGTGTRQTRFRLKVNGQEMVIDDEGKAIEFMQKGVAYEERKAALQEERAAIAREKLEIGAATRTVGGARPTALQPARQGSPRTGHSQRRARSRRSGGGNR